MYLFLEAGQHQANRIKGIKEPKQIDYGYPDGLTDIEKQIWKEAIQYPGVMNQTPEQAVEWYRNKQKEAGHAG